MLFTSGLEDQVGDPLADWVRGQGWWWTDNFVSPAGGEPGYVLVYCPDHGGDVG